MADYKVYKTGFITPFFKAKKFVGMEPTDIHKTRLNEPKKVHFFLCFYLKNLS